MADEEKVLDQESDAQQDAADSGSKKKKKEKVKKTVGQEILSWVLTILSAVAIALVVRSFVFEPVKVDGESMLNTLKNNELMFVSKWDYGSTWLSFPWQSNEQKESAARLAVFGNPTRNDVVICRYPGRGDTDFVKRVVGLPGDVLKMANGVLYVNGEESEAEQHITDEYHKAVYADLKLASEFTVPQKGDTAKLEKDETGTAIRLAVNGSAWKWNTFSSDMISAGGDRLRLHNGSLYLNGEDITSDIEKIRSLVDQEFQVEKDCYFVMGDHRNNSNDSRQQGPITRDMIVGHVRFVFFPFSAWRGIQ